MRPHSTEENVGFRELDREVQENERGEPDPLAKLPLANDASLGDFLSRPVKIYEGAWAPTADINTTIYPWQLFFSNPRVENRLTNFKLLRCNLCVKILINGNSFYYGRLMVNYNPMSDRDIYFDPPDGTFEKLVRLSQRQHILCDPCTSTGGCMQLPFLYDKEFFDVVDINTDTAEIGTLSISTPVSLRQATEVISTVAINVSIYAWATDVVVGGLTNTDLSGLTPQSSPVDETGMKISTMALTASTAVGLFGKLPGVGLYAKATQIALAAAGNLAQMFGFSRPTLVEEPLRYQPRPASSLSTCIGSDNALKLTVDPKQEVAIDPLIWGDPSDDQLEIAKIASTYTVLEKFTWNASDNPGDMIFNTLVDPCLWHHDSGNNVKYPTAVCGVTLPFRYWSGTLCIKLDIVACAFHRGRLAVVYDPHQTPATYEANTTYNEVIDISENRRCEFKISNCQTQSLRRHIEPGITDASFPGASSCYSATTRIMQSMISNAGDIGNGTLSMWVINELTSPNATSPSIEVLVSVKACDDFRVYDPNSELNKYSFLVPQASALEPIPLDMEQDMPVYSFDVRNRNNNLAEVYAGEHVLSLRMLIKRYMAYITMAPTSGVTTNLLRFKHAMYPLMYLYAPDAVHLTSTSVGINYVGHTYISYFRSAFAVMRGGVRWKMVPLTNPTNPGMSQVIVNRIHDTTYSAMADVVLLAGANTLPESAMVAMQHTAVGTAITLDTVNGCLEFETPYYSNFKFVVGTSSEETYTADKISGLQITGSYGSLGKEVLLYAAASEDLTMGHFVGFPAMLYHATIPTPLST